MSDLVSTGPHDILRRRAADCPVVVFDLDGVIREFGPATTERVAADLGLSARDFLDLAFAPDVVEPVIVGHRTFAGWCARIVEELVARAVPHDDAARAVSRWVADRGAPVAETVELMHELERAGKTVFVFTNGTDNIPAELRQIGLAHLVDVVLNSAVLGHRKPQEQAYAGAHAALEVHLGRSVARAEVLFTDDRLENVEAARRFGWEAVHFDAGVRTDV